MAQTNRYSRRMFRKSMYWARHGKHGGSHHIPSLLRRLYRRIVHREPMYDTAAEAFEAARRENR